MQSSILPFEIQGNPENYVISKNYEKENDFVLTIKGKSDSPISITYKAGLSPFELNLCIVLDENSEATLIETWPKAFNTAEYRLKLTSKLDKYAKLTHLLLSDSADVVSGNESRVSELDDGAECNFFAYYFGGNKTSISLDHRAMGLAAKLKTDIISRVLQKQSLDFNCQHSYVGKKGEGDMLMKAVALDEGLVNLEGMVQIEQTGGESAGFLQQETLNLSEKAVVKATPGLKIDTNDVQAGHGSSIRNLNSEDLYYFAARGIDSNLAKSLLIKSFLGANLDKLSAYPDFVKAVEESIETS